MSPEKGRKPRHRSVPLQHEVRQFGFDGANVEVRSLANTDEFIIEGAPVVYDRSYEVFDELGRFEEVMKPGVASAVLARNDNSIRLLVNHTGLPLARSGPGGTLTLTDTPTALTFTARLDARSQVSNDLAVCLERGDVSQMSVGFCVAPRGDSWNKDMTHRTVTAFSEMPDISAVTYAASPSTTVSIAQRMAMDIPLESRARLRELYRRVARGDRLADEEIAALRGVLRAGVDVRDLSASPKRREADPVVRARLQLEASRRRRQKLLLAEIGLRQRRRPTA